MATPRLERAGSPRGFERLLFRAPIGLYRIGLGFVLGQRFLMLEHEGRHSHETRRTVLEVVVNDADAAYVAAGWGAEAQWLKNIRANPSVVVYLGSRRFETVAEIVGPAAAGELMQRYAEEHPKTLVRLGGFMLDDPAGTAEEVASQLAATIPMVRLPKSA